ncbi:MAG: accessory Sec system glycosyltransferase GtfA [Lachnospiraceae bacterium]|nr:accessory Sec system glycosyltransferase GtfA [Lachnospiraceae bacterium]
MTVYSINRGIGWASSGVEYAQAYRAKLLRAAGFSARFIFTDMFRMENIEHLTKNIGFEDEEIIWLYSFFTDFHIAPTTYSRQELEESFPEQPAAVIREKEEIRYDFPGGDVYARAYCRKGYPDIVQRVEYVSRGKLIRKDYFTYGRLFSEYYAPVKKQAHVYLRRFFNEDGSEAWTESMDEKSIVFRVGSRMFYSKQKLIAYMLECLSPGADDVLLLDRATEIGPAALMNHGRAKIGTIIHAEHYNHTFTDERNILWNNFYEFEFQHASNIDFFVSSTEVQRQILQKQFQKYYGISPAVVTIPVGSLDRLRYPGQPRRRHAMITASRLAAEKHIDWLVLATVKARETVKDISLDIYGSGGEGERLSELIREHGAEEYIRLMGHQHLDELYTQYEVYAAASTSEGFGLTLMEAVGSGLAMIGFDVHYGNQEFIAPGENGYLIPYKKGLDAEGQSDRLAATMIRLFTWADPDAFSRKSYEIAKRYLTDRVMGAWTDLLEGLTEKPPEDGSDEETAGKVI